MSGTPLLRLAQMGVPAALTYTLLAASPGHGQLVPSEPRVVDYRTVPAEPPMGTPFELHLTLRVGPDVVLLLPDTLLPAESAESFGAGSWTVSTGPADSIDVAAVYPAIGYEVGLAALPIVELGVGSVPGAGSAGGVSALTTASAPNTTMLRLRVGAVQVAPNTAVAGMDSTLHPRPPADVVGGEWSRWLIFAVGAVALAGLGGIGAWFAGFWSRLLAPIRVRFGGVTAKQEALAELERIRKLGWHQNGRVDDFYAAFTDVLRRFAGRIEPDWVTALTSTELLERLEQRWGAPGVSRLAGVIRTSERVKFGRARPDGSAAEADWAVIRDWVRASSQA